MHAQRAALMVVTTRTVSGDADAPPAGGQLPNPKGAKCGDMSLDGT